MNTKDRTSGGRTPPDVGAADPSSAIDRATIRMNELATNHCCAINLHILKFRRLDLPPRPSRVLHHLVLKKTRQKQWKALVH